MKGTKMNIERAKKEIRKVIEDAKIKQPKLNNFSEEELNRFVDLIIKFSLKNRKELK